MKRHESELDYNETVIYRRCQKIHEALRRMARDFRHETETEARNDANLIIVIGEDGSIAFTATTAAGTFASVNITEEE